MRAWTCRSLTVAALSTAALALPALAHAYMGLHGAAKISVFRQVDGGGSISNRLILDCEAVNIATVNRQYGVDYFSGFRPASRLSECNGVAGNGLQFIHLAHGRWHSVWGGSDVPCHIPGVPNGAAHDLFRSVPRGFAPSPNCH